MSRIVVDEKFKSISPAEFFYRNRELAGFSNPARALYQSVRELVENALDATDAKGILPDIHISIRRDPNKPIIYRIAVKDNGIGISPQYVPEAFGKIFYGSKYVFRQTRGMFGLGAKMVVLYAQMTSGEPTKIATATIGSKWIYLFKIMIDIKENKPVVLHRGIYPNNGWHGTLVEVALEGDWGKSKSKIIDYVRRTAVVAPYANITLETPDGDLYVYRRVTNVLPPPPRETKPHPHGVDIELLKLMIKETRVTTLKEFLVEEFQGVGEVTATRFLEFAELDSNKDPHTLTTQEIEKLANALKSYTEFKPPRADHLSPIGAELIKTGLSNIFSPEFVDATTRKPVVYEGHALIVEVGIAYGGGVPESEEPILLRYANKIPLLYDEKSDVAWTVISKNINWNYYGIEFPNRLVVLTHICGTKIPFKSAGKESIADVPIIEQELENGIRHVLRSLKRYLQHKEKEEELARKAVTLTKFIPDVAKGLAIIGFNGAERDKMYQILVEKLLELVKQKVGGPALAIRSINDVVLSVE